MDVAATKLGGGYRKRPGYTARSLALVVFRLAIVRLAAFFSGLYSICVRVCAAKRREGLICRHTTTLAINRPQSLVVSFYFLCVRKIWPQCCCSSAPDSLPQFAFLSAINGWVVDKASICRTLFVDKKILDCSFCRPKLHRQKTTKRHLLYIANMKILIHLSIYLGM